MGRNLTWNLLLATISIVLTLALFAFSLGAHMMQAEAFSEELSESIGVDADAIRPHLERMLQESNERLAFVVTTPLALISLLLVVRLVTDLRRDKTTRSPG